jgi:hypothetical protein
MEKISTVKKILKILSEKKIYYIFLFLKVSQCKFEQKETILKLGKSDLLIQWFHYKFW